MRIISVSSTFDLVFEDNQMTDPSVAEEAAVGFNYSAAAELFPPPIENRGGNSIDVLRTPRMPSVSRSKSFNLNFFSEHISKSTRRDTTAREFVASQFLGQ